MITISNSGCLGNITLVSLLRDCAKQKDLFRGVKIHADILKCSLVNRNIFIGNTLVFLYSKCGALAKAQQVFDELPIHTLVSWTALITGFSQYGYGDKALARVNCMQEKGFSPDALTFASTLKACASIKAAEKGLQIHADTLRNGLLANNMVLGSALVDMYAKCGILVKAQQVFDELPWRSVGSWNALIGGYCQHGHGEEALTCFEWMQNDGLVPDGLTYSCVLKACGSIGAAAKGIEIHTEIARKGLLESDNILGNALVDLYSKCGIMFKAQEVFDRLLVRNTVSWTTLIIGYCHSGCENRALICFQNMKRQNLSPDAVTLACILQACSSMGAVDLGEELHGEIIRNESLAENELVLMNILLSMYAGCGALVKAQQVFDKLRFLDIVSWNVLISGYCEHGRGEKALVCFEELMKQENLSPDVITFACALRACVSIGVVEKGQYIYDMMSSRYGIIPTAEHHNCMVDLFGRAGEFAKAMAMMKRISVSDRLLAWFSVLGACLKWENVKLGRVAFESVVQLDKHFSAAYVCMSRIYANAGMLRHADEIEAMQVGI